MLFNSLDFAIFLPIVFAVYWFILSGKRKQQNTFLLLSSYIFYGWWDSRFLLLIILSTIVDFLVGRKIQECDSKKTRKHLLWLSIFINLGILGFFKYFNFFIENFTTAFQFLGYQIDGARLNIILPVGISFYTFQTMSYTIDVYKKKIKASSNIIDFAAFVSFFPQLVAGPIERATNLLPQFQKQRKFHYGSSVDGCKQILWGLFKKMVVADNCAEFANQIFNNSANLSGSTLLLGAIFFSFQIYGDFSGYSDMAIGISRLFGFNLKQNFAFPYFSRDIGEFWRRWHISLSTWFRDYLYIPLGGSRGTTFQVIRNVFAIFIISGFWHGASWTFLTWGFLHALFFIPLLLLNKNRKNLEIVAKGSYLPNFIELISIIKTYMLVVLAWIFFRADNLHHAFTYISTIFSSSIIQVPEFHNRTDAVISLILICIFMIIEWAGRERQYAISHLGKRIPSFFRWSIYIFIALFIILYGGQKQDFIYFQF